MRLVQFSERLASLVKADPDAPAVQVGRRVTSRKEFQRLVSSVCKHLSLTHTERVSIVGGANEHTYAAIFACLASGVNYNPVPANVPTSRMDAYIREFKPAAVLVDEAGREAMSSYVQEIEITQIPGIIDSYVSPRGREVVPDIDENKVAYTMFTSGTTGKPKGVQVPTVGVESLVSWLLESVPAGPVVRVAQLAPLGFDLSVAEIIFGILSGGCLVPLPTETSRVFPARFLSGSKITHLFCVPSLIQLMNRELSSSVASNKTLLELEFCLTIGEPLLASQARFLLDVAPQVALVNAYGPTEATVLCSAFQVSPGEALVGYTDGEVIPLGQPFGANRFEIEEPDSRGVGELVIYGPQVALGYLDAEQTRASFISGRDGTTIGYRSGDLVRVDGDNLLRFHGRVDRQVKVGGSRVELGEIESAVRESLPGESAVTLSEGKLICYSDNPRILEKSFRLGVIHRVRTAIGKTLSPSKYLFLSEIPKSSSGKIDYRHLESMERSGGIA